VLNRSFFIFMSRPYKPCRYPACTEITQNASGYCAQHEPEYLANKQTRTKAYQKYADEQRGSACTRGYDHRWRAARRYYLAYNPWCVKCTEFGIVEAATVVDHIKPHKGDPELFWDSDNWQSLCKKCHDLKTRQE
jgi:5-methylcytosine-specific restriction protein A